MKLGKQVPDVYCRGLETFYHNKTMKSLRARRFKRLHEQILLSRPFALIAGWFFSVAMPTLIYWGPHVLAQPNSGQRTALIATTLAYLLAHFGAKNLLSNYPGGRSQALITAQVLVFYGILTVGILLLRVDVSRVLLLASGAAALIWFHIEYILTRVYLRPKFAVIAGGFADEVLALPDCDARQLAELNMNGVRYDGIVADFESLGPNEERFLTNCALANVPVYNAKSVYESLTGRVKIDKMSENNIGSLLPSPDYEFIKAIIDKLIVLATSPIVLPFGLCIALLIRLDTPGPVIYAQTRIGRGNKRFTMYK